MRSPLLALLVALLFSGCGSTVQATRLSEGPALFGGSRVDAAVLAACFEGIGGEGGERFLGALGFGLLTGLDMPLSFAADLLLLPISLPNEWRQGGVAISYRFGPGP